MINITDKDPSMSAVRLRGLSINGVGTGNNGINVVAAGSVSVEDCVIDGFKASGINVAAGRVFVRNTTIRNNVIAGIKVSVGQVGTRGRGPDFQRRGFRRFRQVARQRLSLRKQNRRSCVK